MFLSTLNTHRNKILNIILFTLIAFIILYGIFFFIKHSNYNPEISKYKKNASSVVDEYLSAKITKSEAIDRLEVIIKQVDADYENTNKTDYLSLSIDLSSLKQAMFLDDITKVKRIYKESLK